MTKESENIGVSKSPVFISTKTYVHSIGLSAAFRQWRADSHCKYLHGYSLEVGLKFIVKPVFEFDAHGDIQLEPEDGGLDQRNWVVDFGSLKSFKGMLEDTFDHKTIVAEDDPEMATFIELQDKGLIQLIVLPAVGCERFAGIIYEYAEIWLKDNCYADRVDILEVEVREHAANSAIARNPNYA